MNIYKVKGTMESNRKGFNWVEVEQYFTSKKKAERFKKDFGQKGKELTIHKIEIS